MAESGFEKCKNLEQISHHFHQISLIDKHLLRFLKYLQKDIEIGSFGTHFIHSSYTIHTLSIHHPYTINTIDLY